MIDQVLLLTCARLNAHLAARFRTEAPVVVLSPLTDAEGKAVDGVKNRLALFVVNIAEEAMLRNGPGPRAPAGGFARRAPQMALDISVLLVSAHAPDRYAEGLRRLSAALAHVQAEPLLTAENTPDLPAGLAQLRYAMTSLDQEQVSRLWAGLGCRYLPSALLQIRGCTLEQSADPPAGPAPQP